jgi:hypothetical protein
MSEKHSETFIELCLKGRALVEDVDDFVERWHRANDDTTLYEFLGLSQTEYSLWINDPDVLPYVMYARREQKPFTQVIIDDYYDDVRLTDRTGQGARMRLLREWLERHGQLPNDTPAQIKSP